MKQYEMIRKSGQKLSPPEEALNHKVDQLLSRLSSPNSPFDQNMLRSLHYQIQALQDTDRLDTLKPIKHLQIEDPGALNIIQNILLEQQKGVKALSEILIKDVKDIETMKYGFQL